MLSSRSGLLLALIVATTAALLFAATGCGLTLTGLSSENDLVWPRRHCTTLHEDSAAAEGATMTLAETQASPDWLLLRPTTTRNAVYVSSWIEQPESFSETLPSWNMDVPPGSAVRIELCLRVYGGESVSPWLYVGSIGDDSSLGPRTVLWDAFEGTDPDMVLPLMVVDIDYVGSISQCDAVRYRLTAIHLSGPESKPVSVRRFALTTSTNADDWPLPIPPTTPIDTYAPFRTQKTDDPALSGRLCSPTCVAMLLAYRGAEAPVQAVAAAAFDAQHDIYGNWPRNTQAAFQLGAGGYITRFRDWPEVEARLHSGQPIIASIKTRPGELPNAPYAETDGHLIVIRGIDENGDLLVNDPAAPTAELGMLTYRRADLEHVWLRRCQGTAYIILPRDDHPSAAP